MSPLFGHSLGLSGPSTPWLYMTSRRDNTRFWRHLSDNNGNKHLQTFRACFQKNGKFKTFCSTALCMHVLKNFFNSQRMPESWHIIVNPCIDTLFEHNSNKKYLEGMFPLKSF